MSLTRGWKEVWETSSSPFPPSLTPGLLCYCEYLWCSHTAVVRASSPGRPCSPSSEREGEVAWGPRDPPVFLNASRHRVPSLLEVVIKSLTLLDTGIQWPRKTSFHPALEPRSSAWSQIPAIQPWSCWPPGEALQVKAPANMSYVTDFLLPVCLL